VFKIRSVDASVFPPLFLLEDLKGDLVKGRFYKEQLTLGPQNVEDPDFIFEVEKVLDTKTVNKEKYYFVKYLFYPGARFYFRFKLCNLLFYYLQSRKFHNYFINKICCSKILAVDTCPEYCNGQ
jgi:hypothetical protein